MLRGYAERLLALRREANVALDELRSLDRGRLVLAANEYTCLYLLPVLDRFRQQFPHIGITVQRAFASRIPAELTARAAEIGVLSFSPDAADFRTITVYRDVMAVVVKPGHPLTRRKKVSIADLGRQDFIAHNVDSPLRQRVIHSFQQNHTPLNIAVELPSMEAVKRFVAEGSGVAIVPRPSRWAASCRPGNWCASRSPSCTLSASCAWCFAVAPACRMSAKPSLKW